MSLIDGANDFVRRFREYLPENQSSPRVNDCIEQVLQDMREVRPFQENTLLVDVESPIELDEKSVCPLCFGRGLGHKVCEMCGHAQVPIIEDNENEDYEPYKD